MANIGILTFYEHSVYNGKKIADMTDEEKEAIIRHWEAKGTRCIIENFNDKENGKEQDCRSRS